MFVLSILSGVVLIGCSNNVDKGFRDAERFQYYGWYAGSGDYSGGYMKIKIDDKYITIRHTNSGDANKEEFFIIANLISFKIIWA